MSSIKKITGAVTLILFSILFFLVLGFGLQYYGIASYQFFAPKKEEARRAVYEETKSYIDGAKRDLLRLRREYAKADNIEDKELIKSTIRHRFADFDEGNLDGELKLFLKKIKYE